MLQRTLLCATVPLLVVAAGPLPADGHLLAPLLQDGDEHPDADGQHQLLDLGPRTLHVVHVHVAQVEDQRRRHVCGCNQLQD